MLPTIGEATLMHVTGLLIASVVASSNATSVALGRNDGYLRTYMDNGYIELYNRNELTMRPLSYDP